MESKDLYDQGKTEVRWDDETRIDELVKKQDVVPHFAHHRVHELPDRLDCEEEMDVNLSDQMIHDQVCNLASVTSYVYFLCHTPSYIVMRLIIL